MINRWDEEEEYRCGYNHEHEQKHNHNHYASKSKSTRRVIVSEKMDPTLSYLLVGSSSNTTPNNQTNIDEDSVLKQEMDDEDSTWGYYDHASLSEQSISTLIDCECDSTASSMLVGLAVL